MTPLGAESAAVSRPVLRPHLWSRQEYDRMVEAGVFPPGTRVQLIEGEIIEMPPQGSLHVTGVPLMEDALRGACGQGFEVRAQMPVAIDGVSEPEPDVLLVRGGPRDYRDAHPSMADLVVEVADTTVAFDRGRKQALCARNGIPEYWLLNIPAGCLEVYRQPDGLEHRHVDVLRPPAAVSPIACPDSLIRVADLLP